MPTIPEMLAHARQARQARDMPQVERLCREILRVDPCNVEALQLLGISLHAQGKLAEAVTQYQNVLRLDQARADVWNDLGAAFAMQGRLDDAIDAFQRVVQLKPAFADAHNNLGNAFRLQGRLEQAIGHFRQALEHKPSFAEAHNNLALALLALGRAGEAIASSRQALLLNPNNAEALDSLKKALQLNPNYPEAHNALGILLASAGQYDEAVASYRHAIRLKPDFAEAHSNLGIVLCRQGLLDEGIASFQQALRLQPDFANAHSNLAAALKDQGRLDDMIEFARQARKLKPQDQNFHSNLVGTLNYHPRYDPRAILEELRCWEREHAQPLSPVASSFTNDPAPQRRLRVGYVSADFSSHVVGRNIWPLLRNHDHDQFEVTLYANMTHGDPMTEQFQKCADRWRPIAQQSDDGVVDWIQQDRIDILVDLALHTAGNRLLVFARKPAPVQATFAGYPGSTGLRAINYRLTDPYLDPPGLYDQWYAEESIRLPHTFWCYDPQTAEPVVAPLPASANGFITFGCLNNFCKINDEVLALWANVLRTVPGSRLLLLAKQGSHRQRTVDFFARHGVAAERTTFLSPMPRPEYLASYHKLDIGLDTFPYNGHTTSLDSYWMGVPVVTLVGRTVVGRAGLSQLTNLGLEELAASHADDFVRIAADLAHDLTRLQALRAGLRQRMQQSPLMDATRFARDIEHAYRAMWRTWCAQQNG